MDDQIVLYEGKYTFFVDKEGNLRCKRYDDVNWREFIGDKAVYALFDKCLELEKKLNESSSKMHPIDVGNSLVAFAKKVADKELKERISKEHKKC